MITFVHFFVAGRLYLPNTAVVTINNTDHHDLTKVLYRIILYNEYYHFAGFVAGVTRGGVRIFDIFTKLHALLILGTCCKNTKMEKN